MNAVARVVIVGSVESRERKKIKINGEDKNLAEFKVEGCGLKINAWGDLAVKVPESGVVLIEGALKTRDYNNKEGQPRQSVEMNVSSIELLDVGADEPLGF